MAIWLQYETSASNLALGLRDRVLREVHRNRFCITDEFAGPLGPMVVSKLTWLNAWVRRGAPEKVQVAVRRPLDRDESYLYVDAPRVQLVQAVEISLSTIDQLKAAGANPPAVAQAFEGHLVFDERIGLTATDPYLLVSFAGVEGLPAQAGMEALVERLKALIPPARSPIEVGSITGVGGSPVVANAGLAFAGTPGTDSAGNPLEAVGQGQLVVRIEVGAPPDTADWEAFYANPGAARIAAPGRNGFVPLDRSWALFTHHLFVEDAARYKVEDAMKGRSDFRLHGGVAAWWAAPERRALVTVEFFGTVKEGCEVDVRVQVDTEIGTAPATNPAVYRPGTLLQHAKVNHWKSDLDTAACVALMTALWPFVGAKLADEGGVTGIGYALGLFIPGVATGLSLGFANTGGKVSPPDAACVRPDPEKDEFDCTVPMPLSGGGFGAAPRLLDHFGRPDGLVLLGDMYWTQRLACPTYLKGIAAPPLALDTPHFPCSLGTASGLAAVTTRPERYATYHSRIDLDFQRVPLPADNATRPVGFNFNDVLASFVHSARVRPQDDQMNVFGPWVTSDDGGVDVTVPISRVPATYFQAPYPCRVLVFTSDGARLLTLAPIVPATAAEVERITRARWADTVSSCYSKSQRYNPRWEIDPADRVERHHWETLVGGLRPGELVSLESERDRPVAQGRADAGGSVRLRALLSPTEYAGELAFRRSVDPSAGRPDRAPEELVADPFPSIDTRQLQLRLAVDCVVDAAGPVTAVVPVRSGGRRCLVVLAGDELVAYGVDYGGVGEELARRRVCGYDGALGGQDGVLLWGRAGIAAARLDAGGPALRVSGLSDTPVQALAPAGTGAYVLRDGRIDEWRRSAGGGPVIEAPGAVGLAASPAWLVVGWRERIVAYAREGDGLRVVGSHPCDGLVRVAAAPELGGDAQFVSHGDRTELVDVSGPDGIVVQAVFDEGVPALARCTRDGDRTIEVSPDGDRVRIYRPGRRALV